MRGEKESRMTKADGFAIQTYLIALGVWFLIRRYSMISGVGHKCLEWLEETSVEKIFWQTFKWIFIFYPKVSIFSFKTFSLWNSSSYFKILQTFSVVDASSLRKRRRKTWRCFIAREIIEKHKVFSLLSFVVRELTTTKFFNNDCATTTHLHRRRFSCSRSFVERCVFPSFPSFSLC